MVTIIIVVIVLIVGFVAVNKVHSDPSIAEKRPSCGWGCATCPNRFVCHREKYPPVEKEGEAAEASPELAEITAAAESAVAAAEAENAAQAAETR
jgi:hypothetical protein